MHIRFTVLLIFILLQTTAQVNQSVIDVRNKAVTLCKFFEKNHYQPLQWNDTTSEILYNKWIELLDPEKQFFTQLDINLLETYRYKLDEECIGKSWEFYDKSVSLFLQRVNQIDSVLNIVFTKPIDVSKPDNFEFPFKTYTSSLPNLFQRWQQLTKLQILKNVVDKIEVDTSINVNSTKPPTNFPVLEAEQRKYLQKYYSKRFKRIKNLGQKLEDFYLNTIAWCYDPHSNYMNRNAKNEFETQLSGFEFSAGMQVKQTENEEIEISKLSPGGAAWRSGNIFAGDVILKVKKGNDPEKLIADLSINEINNLLEGSNNEKVELIIRSKNGQEKRVLLPKEKLVDDDGVVKSYLLNGKNKVGYIQLPGFYSSEFDYKSNEDARHDGCANDVSKEIVKLKKDNIEGLILDFRDNGGGNMWEAMQLAGIFIDIGVVGSVKDKNQKVVFLKDPNRGTIYDGPLVIMVNGASASASEFTSAVLQDYHRAVIIGSTTYGKGTAQIVLPMDTSLDYSKPYDEKRYSDFIKITTDKFYRVDGTTTQWTGVVPDVILPEINFIDENNEEYMASEKNCPTALRPDKSKAAYYTAAASLPLDKLKQNSAERIKKDSSFIYIQKWNERIKDKGNRFSSIPLNWIGYIALRKKQKEYFSAISEDDSYPTSTLLVTNNTYDIEKYKFIDEDAREIVNENLQDISEDFYIQEALQVLQDWIMAKK